MLTLVLSACSGTYSLSDRVLLRPDSCVASVQGVDVLQYAVAAWNAQGAHFIVDDGKVSPQDYDMVLPVQCDQGLDSNGSDILGQFQHNPVTGNRIVFDEGTWNQMGKWTQRFNGWIPYTYKSLAIHEMGHALGCQHILGHNIMYWAVQGVNTVNVSADDVNPGLQSGDLADLRCAQTGDGCAQVQYDPSH
jgi:hypothetical protein